MKRIDIGRRFDEIVAFAQVDRFIDTPVKRYSSGMSVRLAFSIAAHLEPEILIVDEVLAVGDAEFQKKCIGKMSSVASGGRTVLFVSHNMGAVATLCGRGLLLRAGRTAAVGEIGEVIAAYMASVNKMQRAEFVVDRDKPAIKAVEVDAAKLARGDLAVTIEFVSPQPISPIGGITLQSGSGFPVWGSNARFHETANSISDARAGMLICEAPDIPLIDSIYTLSVWLGGPYEIYDHVPDALRFSIGRPNERGVRPPPDIIGNLDWRATWSAKEI
jgi:lipopolysaccharide transport system ATP-binding protein